LPQQRSNRCNVQSAGQSINARHVAANALLACCGMRGLGAESTAIANLPANQLALEKCCETAWEVFVDQDQRTSDPSRSAAYDGLGVEFIEQSSGATEQTKHGTGSGQPH